MHDLYVRIRGRVQGPFSLDRLNAMAKRGQISRMHEVSADNMSWQKASDFPEIFQTTASEHVQRHIEQQEQETPQAVTSPSSAEQSSATVASNPVESATQGGAEWHYTLGGAQQEPVSFDQLKGMVSQGTISAAEQVWRDGMEHWTAVAELPELAGAFPGIQVNPAAPIVGKAEAGGDMQSVEFRLLSSTRTWTLFIAISGLVFAAVLVVFGLILVLVGARHHENDVVFNGLGMIVTALVGTPPALILIRYCNRIYQYVVSPSENRRLAWMEALNHFWIYVGIAWIIYLILFVLGVIYIIAAYS